MAEVPAGNTERRGERRLPMTAAVLVDGVLYLLLPAQFRVLDIATYAYPAFLLILVAILILGDPGRIDRQTRWLRAVTGVMIAAVLTYRRVKGEAPGVPAAATEKRELPG